MTPRVERVLAPNPGPYTGPGTNTYVVGDEAEVVVIDPGPIDASHESGILDTVAMRKVAAVVVTHTHEDHAPLANPLARALDVPALGHSPGPGFVPDGLLVEGAEVRAGDVILAVVHTPGHSDDHVCFLAGRTLFTGDHVMGGSSVMVDDVTAYLASLEKVRALRPELILPGHGDRIDRPDEVLSWYLAHRRRREAEIVEAVLRGATTVGQVVERVYADVDPDLHPLAARSVAAHLRKLAGEGRVEFAGGTGWDERVVAAG